MTTHRNTNDSTFDTYLLTLDETTIDNKFTDFSDLKTDLDTEKNTVHGQRTQLEKHISKVSQMLEDLNALKAYSLSIGDIAGIDQETTLSLIKSSVTRKNTNLISLV